MLDKAWCDNFSGAVTICNPEGTILYLNKKACQTWADKGGSALLGQNVLDCHPEPSRTMLAQMLQNQLSNCYTIEKKGLKKLIYQAPLYDKNNHYTHFVELVLELPGNLKHFER